VTLMKSSRIKDSPFGVEIEFDVTSRLDDQEISQLRALFDENHLIVIRDTDMTYEEQRRIASYLGPVIEESPAPALVSNDNPEGILGNRELKWHSDLLFTDNPYIGIGLYALEANPGKTHTRYASAARAAMTLPSDLRNIVTGQSAVSIRHLQSGQEDEKAQASHPILWHYPELDIEVLYVSELQTILIEGRTRAESAPVLHRLFQHMYDPKNVYVHWWSPGDLVIWNNRAIQHARGESKKEAIGPRTLRRIVLGTQSAKDQVPHFKPAFNAPAM
jgi:taurine dioxygenase